MSAWLESFPFDKVGSFVVRVGAPTVISLITVGTILFGVVRSQGDIQEKMNTFTIKQTRLLEITRVTHTYLEEMGEYMWIECHRGSRTDAEHVRCDTIHDKQKQTEHAADDRQ